MNGQLQIIFHLHGCQHHIISFICQIVRSPSNTAVQVHHFVVNIPDIDVFVCPFFIIKSLKIHGGTAISKDVFHHKFCEIPALLKIQPVGKIFITDISHKRCDLIHGTVFFPERVFHNKKKQCEQHIHLLIPRLDSIFFP